MLMTGSTCSDHYHNVVEDKLSAPYSENALTAEQDRFLCQPLPDQYQSYGINDDHFLKVPQTNATMRTSLSSGNTLQCLTMFKNRDLLIINKNQS